MVVAVARVEQRRDRAGALHRTRDREVARVQRPHQARLRDGAPVVVFAYESSLVKVGDGNADTDPDPPRSDVQCPAGWLRVVDRGWQPSPTTEVAPTPAETTGFPQVGQTVSFTNSEGSGTVTLHGARRLTEAEGAFGGTPANGTYLVVDVTVAVSEGSASANPFLWRAQSPDGLTYDADFLAVEGIVDSNEITAGRQLRGNIAFDAPPGPLTVELTTFFSDPLAIFQITG